MVKRPATCKSHCYTLVCIVMVNGQYSSWSVVVSGVPQGSVLGPVPFLLFVNDIPDWIKTNIRIFADDTKICLSYHALKMLFSYKKIWIC